MRRVSDDIYRLGSRYHNYYLLIDGGKATAVDAGCSKELPSLVKGLAQLGMELRDVEAILLTHAHADHLGFAKEASDLGTAVKAHEIEAPMARGDEKGYAVRLSKLPLWKPGSWPFVFALLRAGFRTANRVPGVETFGDGEVLDLPGRPRAIHTPGHTLGHACFHAERSGALFTGDALVTMNVTGGQRGPQMLGSQFHRDEAQARQSLNLLAPLNSKFVLPGHGHPFRGSASDAIAKM